MHAEIPRPYPGAWSLKHEADTARHPGGRALVRSPVSPRTNAHAIARLRPGITNRDCARPPWQVQ
jgi:hypothetical protein